MVSNIYYFHPYLGKIPILTNIFQMGWNHQPALFFCDLLYLLFLVGFPGPVLCPYAHFAATFLHPFPTVSLLTAAGPGYWDAAFRVHGGSAAQLTEAIQRNAPNQMAVQNIRKMLQVEKMWLGPFFRERDDRWYENNKKSHDGVSNLYGILDPNLDDS